MSKYYIGIMCGTSLDTLDVSTIKLSKKSISVVSFYEYKIPTNQKRDIKKSIKKSKATKKLNSEVSHYLASCVTKSIKKSGLSPEKICAVAYPGITLDHNPQKKYSKYIGDINLLKNLIKIPVVANFRQTDIHAGGQGAPMTGYFHQFISSLKKKRICFLNLGGFGNVTIYVNNKQFSYDTGPANYLIDSWCKLKFKLDYDKNGKIAKQGEINHELLKRMSADAFFKKKYPKSTGFERFNLQWLQGHIDKCQKRISNIDVTTTLTYLSISSISQELNRDTSNKSSIFIYGGGVKNKLLVDGICSTIKQIRLKNIGFEISEKNFESVAFAWLASARIDGIKFPKSQITGRKRNGYIGEVI